MRKRFNTLEVALRVRSPDGMLLSEHIIRGDQVELINYFPSGKIWQKADVSLETFIEEVEALKTQPYADGS